VQLEPRRLASGSAAGMLSPTGACHAFDIKADGFVSGEGCVVLLLKRLPDAQRDGDRILAVVRGTAANQDGHTVNIVDAVGKRADRRLSDGSAGGGGGPQHRRNGRGPRPRHPIGDPIEYASLAEVYGKDHPVVLGSVKTNFGHTQATAGALGMMKAILAVQHGVVPKNLHFTEMPHEMAQIETGLFVAQDITPWPTDDGQPRRAAVSSYGMSGTKRARDCRTSSPAHFAKRLGHHARAGRRSAVPVVSELGRRVT